MSLLILFIVSSVGAELTLLRYAGDLYCVSSGEELLRESPALAWSYPLQSGYRNESFEWGPSFAEEFNELITSKTRHQYVPAHSNLPRNLQDLAVKDRRWNDFILHAIPREKEKCVFSGTLYSRMEMAISMLVESDVNINLYSDFNEASEHDNSIKNYKYFKLRIDVYDKKGIAKRELEWCEKSCINISDPDCEESANCELVQEDVKTGSLLSRGKRWTTLQLMYKEEKDGSIFAMRSDIANDTWRSQQKLLRVGKLCIRQDSKHVGLFRLQDYSVLKPTTNNLEYAAFTQKHDAELCLEMIYIYESRQPGKLELLIDGNNVDDFVDLDSEKPGWKLLRHEFKLKGRTNYLLRIVADQLDIILIGDFRICNENEFRVAKLLEETNATCTNLKSKESIAMSNVTKHDQEFIFSCQVGYFGLNCNLSCSAVIPKAQDCRGIVACTAASRCSCLTGFSGENCDSSCREFTYGPRCDNCGNCKNKMSCDVLNGNCPQGCAEGWMGKKCDIECSEGTYGEGCTSRCSNCKGGPEDCDKMSGHCTQGCEDGYLDNTCSTPCTPGTYGENCGLKCSGNCRDAKTCNHVTGICEFGCENGWTGANCNEKCSPGTYGSSCILQCGHCKNETICDSVDGTCPDEDCDSGWIGKTCQTECSRGQYGYRCQMLCRGSCRDDVACNFTTGVCDNGCAAGYKGDKCAERSFDVIAASVASMFVGIIVTLCLIFAFRKYRKFRRNSTLNMNSAQRRNSRPRTLGAENENIPDYHRRSEIYDVIEGGSAGTPIPPNTPDVPSRSNAFELNRVSYDDVSNTTLPASPSHRISNRPPQPRPRTSGGVDNVVFSRRSGETSIGTPNIPSETAIYENTSRAQLIDPEPEESTISTDKESVDEEDAGYLCILPTNIEGSQPETQMVRKAISDENLNASSHSPSNDQMNLRDIISTETIFHEAMDSLNDLTSNANVMRRRSLDDIELRGIQICRSDDTKSAPFPE